MRHLKSVKVVVEFTSKGKSCCPAESIVTGAKTFTILEEDFGLHPNIEQLVQRALLDKSEDTK